MLVVQKYGGTSLQTPKHIQSAACRIKELKSSGVDLVVVVSAMGHTTDHLIRLAKKTVGKPPAREMDMLLTAGERVSMSLLAMALYEKGIPAISFTGSQSGIVTTNEHTEAKIIEIRCHRIKEELQKGRVVIIAGFQGVSELKEITTLGRGGSDTTAVALASVLNADRCEVLTDVDGLFTADPRIVKDAKLIEKCSYDVAIELSSLGAKMQPRSLVLAKRFGVPVRIASSKDSGNQGTLIAKEIEGEKMERPKVTGIPTKDGFTYFKANAKLRDVLSCLNERSIELRFFNFTEATVAFLTEEKNEVFVQDALENAAIQFSKVPDVAIVSVVGEGLAHSSHTLETIVSAIEGVGAESLLLSSNHLSVTIAASKKQCAQLAVKLHEILIPSHL